MTLRSAVIRSVVWCALLSICGATPVLGSDEAQAGKSRRRKPRKVASWGELRGPVGDSGFYEMIYYKRIRGKKRRGSEEPAPVKIEKTRAFLKVTPKSEVYEDVRVAIDQLESGEEVRIFGKPVARRVPDRGTGLGGVDHQIQNARVVLGGELKTRVPFNSEFEHPKAPEHKWIEGKVTKSTGGLWVESLGADHRVTMEQGAPVLVRGKLDPEQVEKRLGKRLYVQFFAYTTRERPETGRKADADRDSFRAAMVVLLDRGSLASVYPMIWTR